MITIKEEFVGCAKITRAVELAGWQALGLWLAMKAYAAENLTDGFVPDEVIPKLRGAPKNARKVLAALVACGPLAPDGSRGAGLVDPHPLGWQLHKYEDHASSATEQELRKEKARERKRRQRENQARELEALKAGQARDGHAGQSVTTSVTTSVTERDSHAGQSPGPRAQAGARPPAHVRERDPSPAQPSPAQPKQDPEIACSLQQRARRWLEDPNRAALEFPQPERWPEVVSLQERLGAVFGLPVEQPRTPRDPRCRLPLERFAEGYTVDQLLRAIAGAKQSRAIADSREYQTLATILRDAAQVDKLAALARPSAVVLARPRETEARRLEREAREEDARRVARGLPPLNDPSSPPVSDPAEIERLVASIG